MEARSGLRYLGAMSTPPDSQATSQADTPAAAASVPRRLFRRSTSLDHLNSLSRDTAIQALGIVFTEIGDSHLQATMPVDGRTVQPYGLLHGGSSVLLAETLGSSAGNLCVDEDSMCVGLEINANHLRAVRDGTVTGTATALHVGGRTQVWEIRIEDARGRLACISRLTLAVVPRPQM
nr:hotdog fold thioesterase [Lysobacter antarcticus]